MIILNLFLRHIPSTLNYGSAMMAENLIYYLDDLFDHRVSIIGDFSSDYDLERMIAATGVSCLSRDVGTTKKGRAKTKVRKAIQFIRYANDVVDSYISKDASAILVLGGDDLSEYYADKMISLELYQLKQLSKKMHTFLVGQTVGPFKSWRVSLARRFLRDCTIYTRDPLTVDYLIENLHLKNVIESRDLAWLDLPKQREELLSREMLHRYEIEKENYFTLVSSGLVSHYCSNREVYIANWLKVIRMLIENSRLGEKKIVLLAHALEPESADDRAVIRSILERVDKDSRKRIVPILDVILPVEARQVLGNGLFTVTGRMHAAVSTFQMGKPAISLSYSVKYRGVIGEGLGMKDLVIEARGDDLWESGKIVDLVMDKVDYVLCNYDSLVSRIKPAVEENKKLAMSQIEDIANKLEGKPHR